MQRYENIKVTNRYDGKRIYTTTYYPTIAEASTDIIIISGESDYLDTLAYNYYKDSSLYWIIAIANNLGNGRLSIPPGTSLRIPTNIQDIINQFNRINT